ncbi:right-handed parallel beta-helix repeat-containing protein [Fischerella thermalis]|jgi:predicted outer membrane repeat protein|uniref:Polymorphic outer membrane protein n=1 Tax=Fischerella thermalis JSC-11 TaxID=741277 RepID=G6G032_9CYAN|nr:right-handed parallel beta-helix repeat-containing protein [Fischerella thermalis]EHC08490.1 polymorphic outer membrane protein [Fischerella thermalis JSC-11]PLZ22454.1 hypothetical protein CBP29_13800 [Fischerella thermalis WC341]PLZ32828.1 hypothetical protein CBP10_08805 [Fischerella thermalis WC558]PLZ33453.1 hypothetical protein CBP28_03625 [Fischerella thermalis WC559]PLZ37530.1 hypothetical protein CBP27_10230 [Fischerella thermalis WC542]
MAIIKVTNTADSGKGSLRAALDSAQAGDTIQFDSSLANKTITLTSGELAITKDITIDGAGAENLTISGNNATRVFSVWKYTDATVKNLNINNGLATGKDPDIRGGGIAVWDYGTIEVVNCNFNNNKGGQGGAIYLGFGGKCTVLGSSFDGNDGSLTNSGFSSGAIATYGSGVLVVKDSKFTNNKGVNGGSIYSLLGELTVENSVFLNNSSEGDIGGGAIFTDGANPVGPGSTVGGKIVIRGSHFENNRTKGEGGALMLYGYGPDEIILEDSTVVGNTADFDDKGMARGGGLRANSALTIRNVTFADNKAGKQGGAIWYEDYDSPVNIINTTFSGNKASDNAGGAMFLSTGTSPVKITNSTIVNNEAGQICGAIWTNSAQNQITLTNCIVANNTAPDPANQQVGYQLVDGGGNIEFPTPARGKQVVTGSRIVDPLLGPLENIGGVLVHPLLPGSPAINTGVTVNGVPNTDQLGSERDSKPDIGSFEVVVTPSPQSSPEDTLVMGVTNSPNNTTNDVESSDVLNGSNNNRQLVDYKAKDILTGNYSHNQPTRVTDSDELVNQFIPAKSNRIQNIDPPENVIDLRTIFLSQSKSSGSNLFKEYIKSELKGSRTSLSVNPEGYFDLNQFQDLVMLDGVTVSSLTDKKFLGSK